MRLVASDFMSLYRPSKCATRVILRARGEKESEPSAFEQVLRELGRRHELQHLETLGDCIDLSDVPSQNGSKERWRQSRTRRRSSINRHSVWQRL